MMVKIIKILSVMLVWPLLLAPGQALADDTKYMAGFYLSIKLIQKTAMSGAADMWAALGASQKAQEINGLAADLEKGDLANEAAMNVFKASGAELQEQIEALESAGAPLTKEQQELARKAYLKITGTTLLWAGAVLAAKKTLETDEIDGMTKLALGALMVTEMQSALGSTRALLSAWGSYRDLIKGGTGMKEPSEELYAAAPQLAAL